MIIFGCMNRRVAVNNDRTKILRPVQELVPDPKQVRFILIFKANSRPNPRMNEEIITEVAIKLQFFEEFKMICGKTNLKSFACFFQP